MMTEKPSKNVPVTNTTKDFTCFHCPFTGCLYHEGSQRHFAKKRQLDQHVAKIHAEKKYLCSKCQKGFGLDWWRKYHEKSCGKQWKCPCGMCYSSRESLLTHARRNNHNLPSDIYCPKRKNWKNTKVQAATQPYVIIIPVTADMQSQKISSQIIKENLPTKSRLILPKSLLPVLLSFPTSPTGLQKKTSSQHGEQNVASTSNEDEKTFVCNDAIPLSAATCSNSNLLDTFELLQHASVAFKEKKNCLIKTAVEAQTNTDSDLHLVEVNDLRKKKESRGSQCSGSVRKQNVRIESTETQTLESALIKLKKKSSLHRSRKRSVAITASTEVNPVIPTSRQKAWSCMKNPLLLNDCSDSWKRLNTYSSSSTQTSHTDCHNKVLCDTQTITDDLLQFNWQLNNEAKPVMTESPSEVGADFTVDSADDLSERSKMPILELFSSTDTSFCSLTLGDISVDQVANQNSDNSRQDSDLVLSPMFSGCLLLEEDGSHKNDAPVHSHTQTQTTTASDFDYCNVLANMETQTTGDFFLDDLEFLDMETQTPWEDMSNIDDTFAVDQLSIEIQTDFPSLDTSFADDPYDFMMGINMPGMLQNCTSKLSEVVNMETQTQYSIESPEFTSSSAQTLDDLAACLFC